MFNQIFYILHFILREKLLLASFTNCWMKIDYFKVRNMSILNLVTNKILNAKYFCTYLMLKSKEIDDIFIQFYYFLTWDPQHNTKITNIAMVAGHWLTTRCYMLPSPRPLCHCHGCRSPAETGPSHHTLPTNRGNHGGGGFYMFIFLVKCLWQSQWKYCIFNDFQLSMP